MTTFMLKATSIVLLALGIHSAAFAAEHSISQKDKKFSKDEIKIKVGDSISFKNEEKDITHNVYSLGPVNDFELKTQSPGQASAVKFEKAGTTSIECAIHPAMKLKVVVE